MSVAFSAIPYGKNSLFDEQELYQLLLAYQEKLQGQNSPKIISFSYILDAVDPLLILADLSKKTPQNSLSRQSKPTYFYWENRRKHEAILGYETTQVFSIENKDRFTHSKQVINECFQNIIRVGDKNVIGSEPYIFCGFSFFANTNDRSNLFPSSFIFLPKLQIIKAANHSILTLNLLLKDNTNLENLLKQIKFYIQKITAINTTQNPLFDLEISNNRQIKVKKAQDFKQSVNSALKSIQANQFNKLVLAHALDITASQDFSLINCLKNLRNSHPDCYVFALNHGQEHSFIGASPERLISVKNQQLVTDSLAGSAPRGKTIQNDQYLAQTLLKNTKERREHQLVIDFITQRLIQLGLTPQLSPLKILKLSNIQHLWTPIYAQLSTPIHPIDIVAKLHPTPAVAGFPTDIACEEIRHYETFERGLYAAPIGWINYQGNSEFIVGIRSALISGNQARLYAGAGIVEGSEAEKELAEIQLKFQGLLRALLDSK